jgi:methionyl-tRNA formyltransferase
VTQPDKPAGRGKGLAASPVKNTPLQHRPSAGTTATRARRRVHRNAAQSRPEAIAVVAFGQILPRAVLDMPPNGCVNVHFRLLPRWRGAAPVQHALLAGDSVTGVTVQHMAEKLDSGDIIIHANGPSCRTTPPPTLWQKLTAPGVEALVMHSPLAKTAKRTRRAHRRMKPALLLLRCCAKKDGQIEWTRPAQEIINEFVPPIRGRALSVRFVIAR